MEQFINRGYFFEKIVEACGKGEKRKLCQSFGYEYNKSLCSEEKCPMVSYAMKQSNKDKATLETIGPSISSQLTQ